MALGSSVALHDGHSRGEHRISSSRNSGNCRARCINGNCVDGRCQCRSGYQGEFCNEREY